MQRDPVTGRSLKTEPADPPREAVNYAEVLTSTVTREEWIAIIQTAMKRAKEGDDKSRAWLADYLVGKAIPRSAANKDLPAPREPPFEFYWSNTDD